MTWIETLLWKKIEHTMFRIDEPYLVLGCTTCYANLGSIAVYNYMTVVNMTVNTTIVVN